MSDIMRETQTFDTRRAVLDDYLAGYPARLDVSPGQRLSEALAANQVAADASLLTFEHDKVFYVIPMNMVLAYNVIQGQSGGQPWMMTFCNACNTGMVFDPVLDGQTLHFQRRGSYDGLLLIWDEETGSYWQHITGICRYGPSEGKRLRVLTTTRQMTAAEVLLKQADARLLTGAPLTAAQQKISGAMEKMRANPAAVESSLVTEFTPEDKRRPRFEMGLGVWNGRVSTFYPLALLHTANNALITTFDGRPLLVYQSPEALSPSAVYLDVEQAQWEAGVLRLDGGATLQHDRLRQPDGSERALTGPRQLLMRWYGFALTFPDATLPDNLTAI